MIRTLIEITSETTWDHNKQLEDLLDKLGFEPKRGEDHGRFMSDLWQALEARSQTATACRGASGKATCSDRNLAAALIVSEKHQS